MTTVPLRMDTVHSYLGNGGGFNWCEDISSIHLQFNVDEDVAHVQAQIPALSTRQGCYEISVRVRPNGTSILGSSCSCPVGYKCKHIYKVLCRISRSAHEPIAGPDRQHLERVARRQRLAAQMEHASVYIALACKSELDSGSDFRRSYYIKDNFDQTILGVFFSKRQANQCAKAYCQDELGYEFDDDDEEDDMEDDEEDGMEGDEDDDEESFVWDGSDYDISDGNEFDKVWVERRAIEDASPQFHT